jgi:predicted metal-dependent hydrolase
VHSESSFPAIGAPIEVRRHPKARRLTLRVSRTRRAVIVTLPVQCDLCEAGSFVHRNIDWVRERLGSLPHSVHFADGISMPLRGVAHRLSFQGNVGGCGPVEALSPPASTAELRVYGHREHAPRRLKDWLWDAARRDLDARVLWHAEALGQRPRRIAVRDQTSRWGSCSTTGVLSFSWRLVLAPPLVLDYVAAHEVAHLAEMNHGARFWALVRRTMPRMDEARHWLQVYGPDLHRYGPARDG